ncbi:hypothetical protein GCM10010401_12910 [Rarobacter faecitabidus]|uniref:Double zinc ribbon protein n=1 Tax=Rarobacter faecitabidus TaxID=13243 RepID=A0A542ZEG4_RARFA|nr:hypothetical protein [Rarobacter faecitabidus]TQL58660.1 hypothetical protein FB461_2078 [Rarobacter faecitabidus]
MSVVELVCPECGNVATTEAGRRSSTDFCPNCDYPLFWARGKVTTSAAVSDDDTGRRSPGIAGAREAARLACPTCRELNDPAAAVCLRCGGPMTVPLPAPLPPAPAPEPVVVRTEVKCNHWPVWTIILVTAAVSIVLTAAAMVFI